MADLLPNLSELASFFENIFKTFGSNSNPIAESIHDVRTFENAEYVCGLAEYEDWDFSGNDTFEEKVRPLEDEIVMLEDGEDIVTGVTAMAAHGHTPGHMGYMIESEGKNLFLGGDFANHYIWSLAYPDWELRFDRDREGALRKQVWIFKTFSI